MTFLIKSSALLFVLLVYFLLSLESLTYIGVLKKYLFVNTHTLIGISILVFMLIRRSLSTKQTVLANNLCMFLIVFNATIYLISSYLNSYFYPNYVFAKFHIIPAGILNIVIFLVLILIITKFEIYIKKKLYVDKINLFVILLLVIYTTSNISLTFNRIINNHLFMATHVDYTYEMKMREIWGSYFTYINFVKTNTENNSTILIPPQEFPWLFEGNGALNNYFLFPRKLVSSSMDIEDNDINKADYIVISKGFSSSNDQDYSSWPKQDIDAKELILIDLSSNTVSTHLMNYSVDNVEDTTGWGLIKLK